MKFFQNLVLLILLFGTGALPIYGQPLAKWMDVRLDACEKAGIDVYPFTDFIIFPKSVWHKYGFQE
ncbi:MAG: hypothetical protein KTR30_22285 [Saprospiraceae bacterium]|nr:hypothetical protein [Saprospiraceae bacterium]